MCDNQKTWPSTQERSADPPQTADPPYWSAQEIITSCFVTQKSKMIPNFGENFLQKEVSSVNYWRDSPSNGSNSARMFGFLTAISYSNDVMKVASLRAQVSRRCSQMRSVRNCYYNSFPLEQLTVERYDTHSSLTCTNTTARGHGCWLLFCSKPECT